MENNFEKAEKICTKEEVMGIISNYAEGVAVVKELSDEKGLYLLEAEVAGKNPNEVIRYTYTRKGIFPNQNGASATVINRLDYEGDMPVGGETIEELDEASGEWRKI